MSDLGEGLDRLNKLNGKALELVRAIKETRVYLDIYGDKSMRGALVRLCADIIRDIRESLASPKD